MGRNGVIIYKLIKWLVLGFYNYMNNMYVQKKMIVKRQGHPGIIDAIVTNTNGETIIMIEGEIFHDGDLVKGFKIKKIDEQTVEFQMDGQSLVQHID